MQEQEFQLSQERSSADKVEKEKEIIALINSKGTSKFGRKANAGLIAYVDCNTNKLKQYKAIVEWLLIDEKNKNTFNYNLEKYHIYHLKVREINNNFLLIDILKKDAKNEILEKILKEYEQKAAIVIEDPDLGKFILDKNLKAFLSKIDWVDPKKQIDVYLNIGEDTRIKALEKVGAFLNTFEKLINNKREWDKKLKIYATENLVDLANELRKNLKGMFKFIKIWKWYFMRGIELISLSINPNGEFVATFDDGKLFLGHRIILNGNINGELINSAIVENFNIEDYKKVEVVINEENSTDNGEKIIENITVIKSEENKE